MTKILLEKKLNNLVASILCLVISFFAAISCGPKSGGSKPAKPSRPLDDDLLTLAPNQADAALWINMSELEKSEIYSALKIFLGDDMGAFPFFGKLKKSISHLDQIEEALFVFLDNVEDKQDEFLVILKGNFISSDILNEMLQNPGAKRGNLESFPLVEAPKAAIMAPTGRTVVFGNDLSAINKVAAVIAGRSKNLRDNEKFADFSLVGSRTVQFRYTQSAAAPDLSQLGGVAPRIDIDSILSLDAEIITGQRLDIQVQLKTLTQMNASKLARELEDARTEVSKNMFVTLLGVDWIVEKIEISSAKTDISIFLKLGPEDMEEIKKLAVRLRKIRELADGAAQDSTLPLEAPLQLDPKKSE